ncbi:hypothetical protein Tco_0004486 [Tanacetum coccineum]
MEISIADQIALDDALVAPADRLKIGKCNLRLSSDVTSKEATLQVVYDVLKLTPFYKAFQVTADAPEIYMQEFWASAYVHNRSDFSSRLRDKNTKKGNAKDDPKSLINQCHGKEALICKLDKIQQKSQGMKPLSWNKSFLRQKEANRKLLQDIIHSTEPPTAPKEKKSGKSNRRVSGVGDISELDLTEAEQLKIITKRSRQETHSSHASGSGADEGTGVTPGVPDAPDYDSEDDISWKSSDDDQDDDEQVQDDEDAGKNDVNETKQDDEDDDDHDDDEKVQDNDEHEVDETAQEDDDEEQTESDDDGDDFVHPKLTTHDDEIIHEEDTDEDDSSISSSDEENSDNDVEGTNVEGAKSDEEATYEEDQGTEAVEDTKTDLDGRDEVMTDVILPQVQATQEIEDTHVTLTPVNPDGQQQSSSVSSGFVSNMLNPNQDTGVDDIFGQHTEATSLIDTSVTAIMEPSFTAQINRPPTPYPLVIQTQQPPILTPLDKECPATTTSSRYKYSQKLTTVDSYLANKMQKQCTLHSNWKYDQNSERDQLLCTINNLLDSIDDRKEENHQGTNQK